jgi:uncharacterized protein (TIGR03066 family)
MRMLLGVGLMLGMTCAVAVAEDIDIKKLMGTWKHEKEKFEITFGKDGKLSVTGTKGEEKFTAKGTYKVEKDKLLFTVEFDGKEKSMTRIVSKLTDTELVSKEEGEEREDTLVRVKGKEKKKKDKDK